MNTIHEITRNDTKRHFVLVRVVSWIVFSAKNLLNLQRFHKLAAG